MEGLLDALSLTEGEKRPICLVSVGKESGANLFSCYNIRGACGVQLCQGLGGQICKLGKRIHQQDP